MSGPRPVPAVELEDVWFSYDRRPVLESLTLRVERGEFLGIIGPNAGGKTTLLKLVLGLLSPDRGRVRVFGDPPRAARGRVGYVPQYASFEHAFPISTLELVLMGRLGHADSLGRLGERDRAVAREALERLELEARAGERIGELSGGQLQRALIARALAVEPELLLLDEPTASVDTRVGRSVYEYLEELADEITVILVSHDIGVLSRFVGSVACLNRRLHYHGSEELTPEVIEETYGAPVDMLAHGAGGRILEEHGDGG